MDQTSRCRCIHLYFPCLRTDVKSLLQTNRLHHLGVCVDLVKFCGEPQSLVYTRSGFQYINLSIPTLYLCNLHKKSTDRIFSYHQHHPPSNPPHHHTMPRSKRAKVVHLSKVTKKGKELTLKTYANIQECVAKHAYLYVFAVDNMRNTYLKDVRTQLADSR